MGLFGGDKETVVGTSTVRVLDDDNMPETIKNSIMRSILSNQKFIVDNVIEDVINGPTINIERMYRKAERGDYIYGLPNAYVRNRNDGIDVVKERLEALEGESITMGYLEFAPLHPIHAAYEYLNNTYQYNHTTNELPVLSAAKGFPVYLSNITPVFPVAGIDDTSIGTVNNRYGNPTSGYSPDRLAQQDNTLGDYRLDTAMAFDPDAGKHAVIQVAWTNDDTNTIERQRIFLDLSGYPTDFEFFQARYETASGETKYWTYQDDQGTYPEIDQIFRVDYTSPGTYFPFVLFRRHRTNRTREAVRDSDEYKSTQDLLDTIGMDFGAMGDSIHENPDIEDVEQAVMMMAVPANSQNPTELMYLFDYFNWLRQQRPEPGVSIDEFADVPRTNNAIVWRDADFRLILSYGGITKKLKAGKLGEPDTYYGKLDSYTISKEVTETDRDGETTRTVTQTVYVRVYRHQINESMYEEIRVTSPSMRYDIWQDYEYLGASDSDELLIPLDRSVTDTYTIVDREILYYRSLRFVFNSRVTRTVKWYESAGFKFVLIVAAIVLTVVTAGGAWQSLTFAATFGTMAVLYELLTIIAIAVAIQQSTRLVLKEIGPENGLIIAIVIAAVAFGGAMGAYDISNLVSMDALLTASSGLSNAVATSSVELSSQYQSELQAFNLMADAKTKELEDAMALLDNDSLIDPFMFIGREPKTLYGESPDDFYNRTVHAGNVGIAAIKSVESYVEISLTLPDINSTVGDTYYD